jgi:hypothetical protein
MVWVVQNVAIDCADVDELARTMPADGPVLYFHQVPEPKRIKNRVHLCLRPETSREE